MGYHRCRSCYDYGMARIESAHPIEALAPHPRLAFSRWVIAQAIALAMALALLLAAGSLAPAWAQGRRLALVVGVGVFQDKAFEHLRYAASDAREMASYLIDPKGGAFDPQDVTLLLDEQATKANILSQTRIIALKSQPQDTVLLYFSATGPIPTIIKPALFAMTAVRQAKIGALAPSWKPIALLPGTTCAVSCAFCGPASGRWWWMSAMARRPRPDFL